MLTWEGDKRQGTVAIMEKLSSLQFQQVQHQIGVVDCQPSVNNGVLVVVLGQLRVRAHVAARAASTIVALCCGGPVVPPH